MPIDIMQQKKRIKACIRKSVAISNSEHTPISTERSYALFKKKHVIPRLKAALERIANGTYGLCIDCAEKISEKRLLSVPAADRCVSCQERVEVKIGK